MSAETQAAELTALIAGTVFNKGGQTMASVWQPWTIATVVEAILAAGWQPPASRAQQHEGEGRGGVFSPLNACCYRETCRAALSTPPSAEGLEAALAVGLWSETETEAMLTAYKRAEPHRGMRETLYAVAAAAFRARGEVLAAARSATHANGDAGVEAVIEEMRAEARTRLPGGPDNIKSKLLTWAYALEGAAARKAIAVLPTPRNGDGAPSAEGERG